MAVEPYVSTEKDFYWRVLGQPQRVDNEFSKLGYQIPGLMGQHFVVDRPKKMMNVYRYDYIYVRTSMNTNFWQNTGSKSDILEIVPITSGMDELPTERHAITRIYQAKDEQPTSCTIYFTDEYNQPIVF